MHACTTHWERIPKEWGLASCTWSVPARLCERRHLQNGFWEKCITYSENRKTYPSFSFQGVIYGPRNPLHRSLSCYLFLWWFLSWRNKTSYCVWENHPTGPKHKIKCVMLWRKIGEAEKQGITGKWESLKKSIGVKRSVDGGVQWQFLWR